MDLPPNPTVHQAWRWAQATLSEAGIDPAAADAWWLLEAATGRSRAELLIERTRQLRAAEVAALGAAVVRRAAREPLQHIVGRASFYGLELRSDRRALVPRPETERLVELALERMGALPAPRVLDVGTGSGAVALAIKNARPEAHVVATDVDEGALSLARENAVDLGLSVDFVRSDLLAAPAVAAFAASADLLATNPPYLPDADRRSAPPEVRRDPPHALYGGPTGLDVFARLVSQAFERMRAGAWLVAELDPRNVRAARESARGWSEASIERDLTNRERFVVLRR